MRDPFPQSLEVVGPLIGDPARLRMLWALLDGRAYTAGELATVAAISPAAASMHLSRLCEAGMLNVVSQGRHRYFRFGDDSVAHAVEALGAVQYGARDVAKGVARRTVAAHALKRARVCYGHLAGELGTSVWGRLRELDWLTDSAEGFKLTSGGAAALERAALDPGALTSHYRVKPCVDWTERTFHLGGRLGRELLERWVAQGMLLRNPGSRALTCKPLVTAASLLERIHA